jgi:hypothetical protein
LSLLFEVCVLNIKHQTSRVAQCGKAVFKDQGNTKFAKNNSLGVLENVSLAYPRCFCAILLFVWNNWLFSRHASRISDRIGLKTRHYMS